MNPVSQVVKCDGEIETPQVISAKSLKAGEVIGRLDEGANIITADDAAERCEPRSPWLKVYLGGRRYNWPLLSPFYHLWPSQTPNVAILNQVDVVTLRDIDKGEVLTYDPRLVIPDGNIAPERDDGPAHALYYGQLGPKEKEEFGAFIPWSIKTEYDDETPREWTVVGLSPDTPSDVRGSLKPLLADHGLDPDIEFLFVFNEPGVPFPTIGEIRSRIVFMREELKGKNVIAVGSNTASALMFNGEFFGWYTHLDTNFSIIPDLSDPIWTEDEENPDNRIPDFFRIKPGEVNMINQITIGRTRVRPIATRPPFPRLE